MKTQNNLNRVQANALNNSPLAISNFQKRITMKNLLFFFLLSLSVLVVTSCEDDPCYSTICLNGGSCFDGSCLCPDGFYGKNCELINGNGNTGGGSSGGNTGSSDGNAILYITEDCGCGSILVALDNGDSKTITSYHSEGVYDCTPTGAAIFEDLIPGVHYYYAACEGANWSGEFTIVAGECAMQNLDCSTGSTSGSGSGNSTGEVTFYTTQDLGCGFVTVNISGYSDSISSYYNGTPGCNADGCANFSLPVGNYNYTASCSLYSWNGTINITQNGCLQYHLKL